MGFVVTTDLASTAATVSTHLCPPRLTPPPLLLQSMLDSMHNFALADWVRLNVYNTLNTSVAVPVGLASGQTPETWRHIDFDQLVYGVGPDASPQQKLHKGSVVFLIQQAEAKAAAAGAGQAAGSAAGGAAGAAPAVAAAGEQPAQALEGATSGVGTPVPAAGRLIRGTLDLRDQRTGLSHQSMTATLPATAAVWFGRFPRMRVPTEHLSTAKLQGLAVHGAAGPCGARCCRALRCTVLQGLAVHDAAGPCGARCCRDRLATGSCPCLQAVAAGSAPGRSRVLRWESSKTSLGQGVAARHPQRGSRAGAAVLTGRCRGRRPGSGQHSLLCLAGQAGLVLS